MMYKEDAKDIFDSFVRLGKTDEEILDFFKVNYGLIPRETFRYVLERLEQKKQTQTQFLAEEPFDRFIPREL